MTTSLLSLIALCAGLAVSAYGNPPAALAQDCTGPAQLDTVTPGQVGNGTAATITLKGSGFTPDSVVALDGYGNLDTTYVSDADLEATVPAGVPAASYDVRVINPDSTCGLLENGLTVIDEQITPSPTAQPTATKIQGCVGPVQIDSVVPNKVGNGAPSTITLIGSGFVSGAVVVLDGYSTLATNFVSDTVLTATVPMGAPAGKYNVRVINPDSTCDVLKEGLRIKDELSATGTPAPTSTPEPTNYVRPVITVVSYGASSQMVYPGQEIDFEMTVQNTGDLVARDVVVVFSGDDLIPRETGGLRSLGDIAPGESVRFWQPLRVSSNLTGYEAVVTITFRYNDEYGKEYTDQSTLSLEAGQYGATATPTPTLSVSPNIVIEAHSTDPEKLTPGSNPVLYLDLVNVSAEMARQFTIRLNLPEASQDTLAILSSNERYVDQLAPGERIRVSYDLAVSGEAGAGLVPVEFELSYIDNYNVQHSEVETFSLRVDTLPFLYVSLFNPVPEVITVGDMFELPIQVINIGTQSLNVTTIEVMSDLLAITDGSTFLGELDSGTSGSLIAQAEALDAGTATVWVSVNYLDDFQQLQVYTHELTFEVQAAPVSQDESQGTPQQPGVSQDMTLWERIKQALLGFFGLAVQNQQGTFGNFQFQDTAGGE